MNISVFYECFACVSVQAGMRFVVDGVGKGLVSAVEREGKVEIGGIGGMGEDWSPWLVNSSSFFFSLLPSTTLYSQFLASPPLLFLQSCVYFFTEVI